ncbi:hypothetical protein [Winogradskyella sp.]|uniref:hypothetical protein n=1 Tax=Winogradskyella sp. TaxID=1883156 RepID=UPI003F6BEFC4
MNKSRFFLFIFFVCSITSCVQLIDGAADAVKNAAADNTPESLSERNYQTVSVNELYQLDVPRYMKEMENLHPDASLKYANIYKEAYTIVIDENKQDFIDSFVEFNEYDQELSPVENYTNAYKSMLNETVDNLKFQDYGLVKLNGNPARQVKLSGIVDGIKAYYMITCVEGEENLYMIMSWTIGDRFEKLETTFEYINGTFKIL